MKDSRMVIITNRSNVGIVNDDPELVDVSIQAREMQADYFFSLNLPFPEYLRKYLVYMYEGEDNVNVETLYKYGASNGEFKHIVAIIQMVSYALKVATRENKGVRFFLEEPETRLHPKRQRQIMPMVKMLEEDFGPKQTTE